ncbi:hypothetical protein ACTJJ0_30815 [Chitinophaga sp. 22321]|uniref:Uncharacterized protein n=1 Tax=Chitinophaga hostae TaxID=2831022 RepID=A0ABS5J938_9BACT|nr:hypothetical protein [Chitinophaga hostae]MBS0031611.1 hypothetical protein [Chitinophaga hostae]
MSIENARQRRDKLIEEEGKVSLNVRYPREFEYYVCAFELVNGKDKTLRYFIFPVMPSSIDESQPRISNIKKTVGGIVALSNTTFTPIDITLSGNFGRKFRILLGADYTDLASAVKIRDGQTEGNSQEDETATIFDERVKTGYGCLKILEEIIAEADKVDALGPRRLIFYNLAFGNSYIVKPTSFKISMNQDSNMIHNYSLSMKAIAPLDAVTKPDKLKSRYSRLQLGTVGEEHIDASEHSLKESLYKDIA